VIERRLLFIRVQMLTSLSPAARVVWKAVSRPFARFVIFFEVIDLTEQSRRVPMWPV
jgi:hypothetical protein